METKKCSKCKSIKLLVLFGPDKRRKDGKQSSCRDCRTKFRRTKYGLISKMYSDQRGNSKKRKDPMPSYTLNQFRAWIMDIDIFHDLFEAWVNSGYNKLLIPSCDRADDNLGYSLDRLSVITWAENKLKGEKDKKEGRNNKLNKAVLQLTKKGMLVSRYHSQCHAARVTNSRQSNISSCCSGRQATHNGFKWKYANEG